MKNVKNSEVISAYQNEGYNKFNLFLENRKIDRLFLLTDENTEKYCLPVFKKKLDKNNIEIISIRIKSGEQNKNIKTCESIWKFLLEKQSERKDILINLGGGVICDLGGFAASAFKRGISFVNVPTSLLAQVDAAVGGKVGVNFYQLKNQIGFFANPELVLFDDDYLKTLPEIQLLSGFAEIIKHALIADAAHWKEIRDLQNFAEVEFFPFIKKSVQIKTGIVNRDPFEFGERKILNFGHTIGHALETFYQQQNEKPLLHGEAVAFGMICESYISSKLTGLPENEFKEITKFLKSHYGIFKNWGNAVDKIIEIMKHDKKNRDGKINFTLLSEIGKAGYDFFPAKDLIIESIRFLCHG